MSEFTDTRDYYDEAVKMGLTDDYETFSKTESDGLLSDDDFTASPEARLISLSCRPGETTPKSCNRT